MWLTVLAAEQTLLRSFQKHAIWSHHRPVEWGPLGAGGKHWVVILYQRGEHAAPGFALTPHGKPMNPWNKQQRQEMKHTGNRCISPESHLSYVTEWPLLGCCAVPKVTVSPTPTPPPRAHAQGREGAVIAGVLRAPARAQHELFITASSPQSCSQDGACRADTKSKNVGKFIYFSKTFLICNVLSKNVLADPAPAIFSHSI